LDVVAAFLQGRPREGVGGTEIAYHAEGAAVGRGAELIDGRRPSIRGRGGPGDPLADELRRGGAGRQRDRAGRQGAILERLQLQTPVRRAATGRTPRPSPIRLGAEHFTK